jgi:putative ABC transport system permease protein
MARRYWPGQSPIGKRYRMGSKGKWQTVVGVVGDVKVEGLNDRFGKMEVYFPWSQETRRTFQRTLIVRATENPNALIPALKSRIWALDKDQPIYRIHTVDHLLSESLAEPRFYFTLMSCFAGVALLLVAMGIYSVIAYQVSQRTHEIGIRMALGACALDVLRLVLRQGMGLVLAGIGVGVMGAYAATRLISTMLFGISPTDPWTFAGIMLLLVGVGLLACYLPARRAAKMDPMVALRCE